MARARSLEVSCGAAQYVRWVSARGAEMVGLDLPVAMLGHGWRIGFGRGLDASLVQGRRDPVARCRRRRCATR